MTGRPQGCNVSNADEWNATLLGFLATRSSAAICLSTPIATYALLVGAKLLYVCPMRCTFDLDGEPRASWTEEREDLPLYVGNEVTHRGSAYAIVDGPHYVADWESASIGATFVVKAAPTSRR
jgi:hypothetical protein